MRNSLRFLTIGAAAWLAAGASLPAQQRRPDLRPIRDLEFARPDGLPQLLDLYLPATGEGPFPLIVWIHGGGWRQGDKTGCLPATAGFAGRGYAVASINYRLTGLASHPAQIQDCKAAIRWLRAHAAEYKLAADRIGVWGSSAGGHLAALVGTSGGVPAFDVGEHLDQSSRVQAVCDYYGPADFLEALKGAGGMRGDGAVPQLLGGPWEEKLDAAASASPTTHVDKDDPPFFIVHGTEDRTVPLAQSELMVRTLRGSGVPVELRVLEGAGHGGPAFQEAALLDEIAAFFDRHLRR